MTWQEARKSPFVAGLLRHEPAAVAVQLDGGRNGSESSMRATLFIATALLLSSITVANAADPIRLAETGGFLLGNAHRCGVPAARVKQAGKVIHHLIVAASFDPTEEAAAASRFSEIFAASAHPDREADALIPACGIVIAQFQRLEQHHHQAGLN
jgi:hypothetical protein